MKKKIAVIGGGIAGIVAANELATKADCEIVLIEKSSHLGGLKKSYLINGIFYDAGCYMYTEYHQIFKLFPELKPLFVEFNNKKTLITPQNVMTPFPYSLKAFFKINGLFNFLRVVVHLLIDKVRFYKYQSLEEYCKYYTGTFFYKMSGLSNYIKRFHADIPVNEVSKEFGEQRISGLQHNGIRKFMRRGLSYFAKKMAGSPSKVFSRPKEGYQMLFEKIENILTNKGITIQKDINIQKIERKDAQFQLYTEKEILFFDYVIFTTPLEVVASLFNRKLSYPPKHIHLLSLFYKGKVHSSSNVIYNFSNEGNWKRMIVFSKYYGQHEGKDYFTIEVPITTYNEAKISELQLDFEQFVQKTPFFEDIIFQGKAFTPYAYPLLDPKIEATRNQLISEIEAEYGILLIGRQGKHEYLNSSPIIANTIKDITVFWEKMQQIVY